MVEETTNYDGQGLKGALWTIAGTSIAGVAQRVLGGALNGGCGSCPMVGGGAANGGLVADLLAKTAKLEAEKYSDNAAKEEANRLLQNYLKPYGDAIAANQVEMAKQQAEIDCLKKTHTLELENMSLRIDLAKQEAKCCCEKNRDAIFSLSQAVNSITKVIVPNSAICPAWGDVTVTPSATTTTAA